MMAAPAAALPIIMRYLLLLLLLPLLLTTSPASAQPEKKNILYLNSYHHGYRWSDEEMEGIRSVLAASSYKIDLQIEYMDAKKFNYDDLRQRLFTLYAEKFRDQNFDVIIISDNDALNFLHEFRERLFPGVPVVFTGVNGLNTIPAGEHNLTGIIENFDLTNTLKIARTLHPEKKKMVVLGDDSSAGRAIQQQVMDKLAELGEPLAVDFWSGLTVDETIERVRHLSQDTFLFFIPWYQTVKGHFYTTEEVIRAIYRKTDLPLYTAWGFLLGHGTVGGYMLSGVRHGQIAAGMALRILAGEKADAIPIENNLSGVYMFDHEVMERLHIKRELLPAEAVIINLPKAFYELPKELFWTIVVSILLLLAALVSLLAALSARRRLERQAREQLSFQETLMDTIPQLVSWKNAQGRYLGANRSFSEFFGLTDIDFIINKTAAEIIPDHQYSQWSENVDRQVVMEGRPLRKMRREIVGEQGEASWIEVNKVPLRDQRGSIVGVLTTAENVTREFNLEKQLIQSQKMEAIGTLAGGIAHDFNNILTSIINSTELALGDVAEDSQTAKDLRRVVKAARRGARVVKQILSFSRPSTEGFRPADITRTVQEVAHLLEASVPANVRIDWDLPDGLFLVDSDPTQIHQVLLNLCTNALHALRDSGGRLRVELAECQLDPETAALHGLTPGAHVRLRVADTGHGIDPQIRDKIFDPFFSTKDITEGTGLGLAVVHGIVSAHRGAITVHSKPGEGTEFSIYLPKSQASASQDQQQADNTDSQHWSILFVEDDEDQLNAVPRILRDMGHRVTACRDASSALQAAQQQPGSFDCLLTDYDMPGQNGAELARALPGLPALLVSGREDALLAAASVPNIVKVLLKPYDRHDLRAALARIATKENHAPDSDHR